MSIHLPIIQQMFPKKLVLNINEIATLIDTTPDSIYSMIRDTKLPFKLLGTTRKIQVLVVEIANYLDRKYESQKCQDQAETTGVVVPKKVGRPRGSSRKVSPLLASFQNQLAFAISQHKANTIIRELEMELEELVCPDDGRSCAEKYEELKSDLITALVSTRNELEAFGLSLSLSEHEIGAESIQKI